MRGPALLVVIIGSLIAGALSAQEPSTLDDATWKAALERAQVDEKPIVVYTRPPDCRNERSRYDPCKTFEEVLEHPAIVRRLDRVVFLSNADAVESASITVYDPGGRRAIRWERAPDGAAFRQMLNLVDGATEHLVAGYRARHDGEDVIAARESMLVSFALGHEALGRSQLRQLAESPDEESRQLATIWGTRLDLQRGAVPDESGLRALAFGGSTDRVRLEAWVTIGDLEREGGRREAASAAYGKAIELAPDPSTERNVALTLLQRTAESTLQIAGLGKPGSPVAGRRTLQPLWNESSAARVEYRLDGRLVATSRKAPFAAGVNFGRLPKRQELTISALDKDGHVVRSAGVMVNDRTDALAIEIVEPASPRLSGTTAVEVSVRVPYGRTVQRVVIEWNGVPASHSSAPPYRAQIDVKAGELGILRAAARLDDRSEVEDVRLFNTGEMLLESEVHLVEVPVYSSNRRLTADEVVVKEAGVVRPVDRVIAAADAPLVVALVLDVSKSMEDWVLHLEEAALEFVESLDARDRVMVVAFDSVARVALWPTSDRSSIERAIQHLRVKGATALDDAMILSLLQLQSIGSRHAMVVMSDAWDNSSIFKQDDVEEVARRSAVPIYVLTLNPRYDRPPTGRGMPLKSRDALHRWVATGPGPSADPAPDGPSIVRHLNPDEMNRVWGGEAALLLVARALRKIDGRKLIILPSWGFGELFGGRLILPPEWSEAVGILRRDHIPVISVGAGVGGALTEGVRRTATSTGGVHISYTFFPGGTTPSTVQAVTRVDGALAGYYELVLRMDRPLEPGQHRIVVRTKNRKLVADGASTVIVDPSNVLYDEAVALINAGQIEPGIAALRESILKGELPRDALIDRLEVMVDAAQWEAALVVVEELERIDAVDEDVAATASARRRHRRCWHVVG